MGKTSIGKYLKYLNRTLALDTEPSTRIEKYVLKTFRVDISIFVTPGQKRFRKMNQECLCQIIDQDTIIYYVIDASADAPYLKSMLEDYLKLATLVDKLAENKKMGKITIALLAHKRDLPQAIDGEKILKEFILRLERKMQHLALYVFNTSIYLPETLLRVFRETIFSKIFPMDSINDIVGVIKRITNSDAVVVSDTMGFPIATCGDGPITTWLSVFPTKIIASFDQERNMIREYQRELWIKIFDTKNDERIFIDMLLEMPPNKRIYFHIVNINSNFICLSMYNPKNTIEILRETAKNFAEKIYDLFSNLPSFK